MIDLLHINLMAERSESWDMHIYSLECMLTFAGTGHNNCSRSLFWFVQEMTELRPRILNEFQRGLFVVRRTNTCSFGVSPDLCIEQTRMAGLKRSSGLTRGRSVIDVSRLIETLSRPGVRSANQHEDEGNLEV